MHQKQAPAHTGTAGVCCSEHSEPGTEAARSRSIRAGSGASAPARSAPPAHHRRPGQSHAADARPGGPCQSRWDRENKPTKRFKFLSGRCRK